tara:strand:+ start:481 stop:591 length:111 start_codon:yes stop_codon:yes gene_type:complete
MTCSSTDVVIIHRLKDDVNEKEISFFLMQMLSGVDL